MNWQRIFDRAMPLLFAAWIVGVPLFCMSVWGLSFWLSIFCLFQFTVIVGLTLWFLVVVLGWSFGELSLLARLGRGRTEPKKIWIDRIAGLKSSGKIILVWAIALSAAWQLNVWAVAALDEVFPRYYFGNVNNPACLLPRRRIGCSFPS